MRVSFFTLTRALSETKWSTCSQVTDMVRQLGPLGFLSEADYLDFHYAPKRKQYQAVYSALLRNRGTGVDVVLGSDDGRETRVFMLVRS